MPLRTVDQVSRSELAPKYRSSADMERLSTTTFHRLAELASFFTPLTDIKGYKRDALGSLQELWSFSSARQPMHQSDQIKVQQLKIQHSSLISSHEPQEWMVATRSVDLPSQFEDLIGKHRLSSTLTLGLAANLRSRPSTSRRDERLAFSAMPLPIILSVPVHVNAPFILADDRQSIRFDDSGLENRESKFNRWLLRDALPALYYHLLSQLPSKTKVFDWWPQTSKDPIASAITDGFYSESHLLSEGSLPICIDLKNQPISPTSAVFLSSSSKDTPPLLLQLFQTVLRPPGIVVVPVPDVQKRVLKARIKILDPDRARTLLLAHTHALHVAFRDPGPSRMTVAHVESLITFLANPSRLKGLPLLPLADGTLASFDGRITRYIAKAGIMDPWPFLPADRFAHPGISACLRRHYQSFQELKLSLLTGEAMARLVRERIPESPSKELSEADAEWARTAWSMARLLPEFAEGEHEANLSQIPLVPTAQGRMHVSLASCIAPDSNILIEPASAESHLVPIMLRLGAICIKVDGFSPELQNQLGSKRFSVETVLSYLQSKGPAALQIGFSSLPGSGHLEFAHWVERELKFKKHLRTLKMDAVPVWRAYQGGCSDAPVLKALTQLDVLPPQVPVGVVRRFLNASQFFVEHSSVIVQLGKNAMTWATLIQGLIFPPRIRDDGVMREFKALMEIAHSQFKIPSLSPPRLPNAEGELIQASVNSLFVRSQPVFAAAFASEPSRFLHPQLEHIRMHLQQFGVHSQVTFSNFKVCAEAIAQDRAPDRAERARIVFEHYSSTLPFFRDPLGERASWRQLDRVPFIPVDPQRRDQVTWSEEYAEAVELGKLCAPIEMLRSDMEAIAWTQRYRFLFEPDDQLFRADPTLGVPTAVDVVYVLAAHALSNLLTVLL
jgi:hypothetical protein